MLPFCERVVSVPRKDVAPVWTRSFPISKEPTTLGQHLRKKRFMAGIRQSEAAQILGVSDRALSLWETDRVYPAWAFQPRLITYLGCDVFTNPALGSLRGNEPSCVAFLSQTGPPSMGHQIVKRRMELRKNREQCAEEMGISVKTLKAWETNRYQPSSALLKRLVKCLGLDLESSSRRVVP
jgi:DNA-binding XRE family transcriptional regulator